MSFFDLFKSGETSCPEGSVHAYEYDGKLYKTKAERDMARRKDNYVKARKRLILALQNYPGNCYGIPTFRSPINNMFDGRYETVSIKEDDPHSPALFKRVMGMGDLADLLLTHLDEVVQMVEDVKRATQEKNEKVDL